jgi:hypothetical protein
MPRRVKELVVCVLPVLGPLCTPRDDLVHHVRVCVVLCVGHDR